MKTSKLIVLIAVMAMVSLSAQAQVNSRRNTENRSRFENVEGNGRESVRNARENMDRRSQAGIENARNAA